MATNRGGAASLRNNTDRKDGTVTGGGRTRNDATNDEPLSAVIPNGIGSIALDQLEQNLAIVTLSGRIYGVDFKRDWYSATVSGAANSIPFNPICQMAHTGRINGLSCSVRKPFLMSSSSDHSVRLWNTQTRKLEQCTFFKQEPGALSVHPSGLMAVICFPDKVRVMSILWNSLRERKVINFRNGHSVQFSNGGQYFAISHGNLVDIFNSATLENLGQLRGHPQRVSDFKWCSNSPLPHG
ncbi:WD domain, G-beta repeat, putative [Angomonas deanei]|uniref:WD domain, G-beta repeat, putative n=1 Tax=Angomonas deanei TaxID=59799 RepID=A0A7G2CQU7_9TRYP|nr:WD domain, G-beta repeat, putative [Angomonas deanei]